MTSTAISAVEQHYFGLVCLDCHEKPARISTIYKYCYKCGKEKSFYVCTCGSGLGHDDRGKVHPYCGVCGSKTSKMELTPLKMSDVFTSIVKHEKALCDNVRKTVSRMRKKQITVPNDSSQELFPAEDDNTAVIPFNTPKNLVKTELAPSISSRKTTPCPICHNLFARPYLVKEHLETQHNLKRYQCELCDDIQKTILRLRAHYRKDHPEAKLPADKSLEHLAAEAVDYTSNLLSDKIEQDKVKKAAGEEKSQTGVDNGESSDSENDEGSSSSLSSEEESDSNSIIYDASKLEQKLRTKTTLGNSEEPSLPLKSPESPKQASVNSEITSVDLQTSELTQKPPHSPKKQPTARRSTGKPVKKETAEKPDEIKKPTTKSSDQRKSTPKKLEAKQSEPSKPNTLLEKKKRAAEPAINGDHDQRKSPKKKLKKSDLDMSGEKMKEGKRVKSDREKIGEQVGKKIGAEKEKSKRPDKLDAGGDMEEEEVMEVQVYECVLCGLEFPSTSKLKRHYKKLHGSLDENSMNF